MQKIPGIKISKNQYSNRITEIIMKEESLDKLIFPFKKFDVTALEYNPAQRCKMSR